MTRREIVETFETVEIAEISAVSELAAICEPSSTVCSDEAFAGCCSEASAWLGFVFVLPVNVIGE